MIEEFEALGVKSKANAQEAMDTEAMLGDIPDEFLDPIQVLIYIFLRFCSYWLTCRAHNTNFRRVVYNAIISLKNVTFAC